MAIPKKYQKKHTCPGLNLVFLPHYEAPGCCGYVTILYFNKCENLAQILDSYRFETSVRIP